MLIPLLQSLTSANTGVMREIWHLDIPATDLTTLISVVTTLRTQLEVQAVLLSTEKLLRKTPGDTALPNQLAQRIKHLMRLVFEPNSRDQRRQERLKKLDCSSLKLCGLSYTVREIIELPTRTFDFLVDNIADYVQSKQLAPLLCRDDINKTVLGDFDPEDEESFKRFVTSHIEIRINERRRRRALSQATATYTEDLGDATGAQRREDQAIHVRKRARVEQQCAQDEQGRSVQYMYSKAPTDRVALLGNLLSEAVRSSRQWQMERSLEERTTDCITTIVPKNQSQDISITLWVGQEAGLRMNDVFRLVPNWTSSPSHVGPSPDIPLEHGSKDHIRSRSSTPKAMNPDQLG